MITSASREGRADVFFLTPLRKLLCVSPWAGSAAFLHYEVQANHIFWDQKAVISGTWAPPLRTCPRSCLVGEKMGLVMLILLEPVLVSHFLLPSMEVGRALLGARDSGEQGKGEAPGTEPDNTEHADIN